MRYNEKILKYIYLKKCSNIYIYLSLRITLHSLHTQIPQIAIDFICFIIGELLDDRLTDVLIRHLWRNCQHSTILDVGIARGPITSDKQALPPLIDV